ncbi:hypothetical protein [Paraburkholderia sediminicola]|uniref:hypothetical protein n=1 Tax=Paraburkholderia sediminicola TaxID=458836 RepID=UPI0038BC0B90
MMTLTGDKLDVAQRLARLPDDIRGFGHVKEHNMATTSLKRERLLAEYRNQLQLRGAC